MPEIRDDEDLWQMVPAKNKAKRFSSVNHTTKTIHHHHDLPTNSKTDDVNLNISGYNLVRSDYPSNSKGGGVGIY